MAVAERKLKVYFQIHEQHQQILWCKKARNFMSIWWLGIYSSQVPGTFWLSQVRLLMKRNKKYLLLQSIQKWLCSCRIQLESYYFQRLRISRYLKNALRSFELGIWIMPQDKNKGRNRYLGGLQALGTQGDGYLISQTLIRNKEANILYRSEWTSGNNHKHFLSALFCFSRLKK